MFPAAGVPNVPYTPAWPPLLPTVLLPPIHAHRFVEGLSSQRSLRLPLLLLASKPSPPKSQRLPPVSVQLLAAPRLPGTFPAAGVPNAPYTPGVIPLLGIVLLPPIQVHSFAAVVWAFAT